VKTITNAKRKGFDRWRDNQRGGLNLERFQATEERRGHVGDGAKGGRRIKRKVGKQESAATDEREKGGWEKKKRKEKTPN